MNAPTTKHALSGLSCPELEDLAESMGQPRFRGRIIHKWIYAKQAQSIEQMTDLPANFRKELEAAAQIPVLKLAQLQVSSDGTRKYLFELPDGQVVESVLMRFNDRSTLSACVSSQVGCAVGCTFCATGYLGFTRNLTAQEIVDQIMCIQRESGQRISNVVYMGQGEPLLNLDEVIKSIQLIGSSVGIGARHLTVSTSGIVPGITRLANEGLQVTLALSLHSPDQARRQEIVPLAKKYNLSQLMKALHYYQEQSGRRITIEYVLLSDVTDSPEQAQQLADLVKDLHCNINLIPYNPTVDKNGKTLYERPAMSAQERFKKVAGSTGKTVTIRHPRGTDIQAACGQLRNAYSSSSS